jgi:phosphoheptose isomerase
MAQALGKQADVLMGISTPFRSKNIDRALAAARGRVMQVK